MVTIALILFAFLLPLAWIPAGHFIFRNDPFFPFHPAGYAIDQLSLWLSKVNLGAEKILPVTMIPYQFLDALPAFLGASDRTAEIIHFMIWFSLPGLTMALFASALWKRLAISPWVMPVATAFYLFNLYRVAIFGDSNHQLVYAALPLGLYCLTLALDPLDNYLDQVSEKKTHALPSWLIPSLGFILITFAISRAGSNPPMYVMFWLPSFAYGLLMAIYRYKSWKQSLFVFLTIGFGTFLINLFWLVPFYFVTLRQSGLAAGGNSDWLNDLSQSTSFERVVRLIGAWDWFSKWETEPYVPFAKTYLEPFWYSLALVPGLLALCVLFFKKAWNRFTFFSMGIGVIGLLFSQGTHPPMAGLFEWAVKHLPFFWSFRSPWYKFTNLTAFSYSILAALAVGYAVTALQKSKATLVVAPLIICVLSIPLLLGHSFVDGSRWIKADQVKLLSPDIIEYPKHIEAAADWLNAQPKETGVGLLPYMGAEIYRWGAASIVDPLFFMTKRPLFVRGDRVGYQANQTPGASVAYRVFKEMLYDNNPNALYVAKLLGMEYLVVRQDFRADFYPGSTDSPQIAQMHIEKTFPDAKLVRSFGPPPANVGFPDAPTGNWLVYQLPDVQTNQVFATDWVTSFTGHPIDALGSIVSEKNSTNQFPGIFFTSPIAQPHPDEVTRIEALLNKNDSAPLLSIHKTGINRYDVKTMSDKPFLLVLNQSDDTNWQVTNHSSLGAKVGQRVVVNGYAPAWLIEPVNGSEIHLTIEFGPQRYVLPLLCFSIAMILTILAFFGFSMKRTKKQA